MQEFSMKVKSTTERFAHLLLENKFNKFVDKKDQEIFILNQLLEAHAGTPALNGYQANNWGDVVDEIRAGE